MTETHDSTELDRLSEALSDLAGQMTYLRGRLEVVEELVRDGDSSTIPHLQKILEDQETRLKTVEDKVTARVKSADRWVDYDREMKSVFMTKMDDTSDWEPWCLVYWFRWLRRSTPTKSPITSWGDYKKQVSKAAALVEHLGSMSLAKQYLEYAVFGKHGQGDLNFHQVTSGHFIGKFSGQVNEWIADRDVEQKIKELRHRE